MQIYINSVILVIYFMKTSSFVMNIIIFLGYFKLF